MGTKVTPTEIHTVVHPCGVGTPEVDHDKMPMIDDQGEGVWNMSWTWIECAVCGMTWEDDGSFDYGYDNYDGH